MQVAELATGVTWAQDALSTRAGTAVVSSDEANWTQAPDGGAHYPPVRRHALYVSANQIGSDAASDPFFVAVECEGGFSGAANPPEMSGVKFYLGRHATGTGTSLAVRFQCDAADVDRVDDRWMLGWTCAGSFKLRHEIEVDFGARLLVDTYGMFHLENPWVSPQSGQSSTTGDGRLGMPLGLVKTWNWHARLATDAAGFVPMLQICFTRR